MWYRQRNTRWSVDYPRLRRSVTGGVSLAVPAVVVGSTAAHCGMSRAFVNEDAGPPERRPDYDLPARDAADFEVAAARALLEGARAGDTVGAEDATGYRWGDPHLVPHVRHWLTVARQERDDRLEQLAERYLRAAGETA